MKPLRRYDQTEPLSDWAAYYRNRAFFPSCEVCLAGYVELGDIVCSNCRKRRGLAPIGYPERIALQTHGEPRGELLFPRDALSRLLDNSPQINSQNFWEGI